MAELATKAGEKASEHGVKKVEPWHVYVPLLHDTVALAYTPFQLDRQDVSQLNVQAFRKQMALVSQEPVSNCCSALRGRSLILLGLV